MTAVDVARKLNFCGGNTTKLTAAECELLMRALRSWDDMLDALKTYEAWFADVCSDPQLRVIRERIRAAIARAEGRAP